MHFLLLLYIYNPEAFKVHLVVVVIRLFSTERKTYNGCRMNAIGRLVYNKPIMRMPIVGTVDTAVLDRVSAFVTRICSDPALCRHVLGPPPSSTKSQPQPSLHPFLPTDPVDAHNMAQSDYASLCASFDIDPPQYGDDFFAAIRRRLNNLGVRGIPLSKRFNAEVARLVKARKAAQRAAKARQRKDAAYAVKVAARRTEHEIAALAKRKNKSRIIEALLVKGLDHFDKATTITHRDAGEVAEQRPDRGAR